jgi:hypothetical protein
VTPEPIRAFSAIDGDPDIEAPAAPATALDELRSELTTAVESKDSTLAVPAREGYAVRYSTTIAHEQLNSWRKRARDKSMPGELDELRWAAIVLANQCRAIVRKGTEVELDGSPATFAHPGFRSMLGAERAVDAVRSFYGRDADVITSALTVLRDAGYGDEVDTDPLAL